LVTHARDGVQKKLRGGSADIDEWQMDRVRETQEEQERDKEKKPLGMRVRVARYPDVSTLGSSVFLIF